jgi:hypothetical protein
MGVCKLCLRPLGVLCITLKQTNAAPATVKHENGRTNDPRIQALTGCEGLNCATLPRLAATIRAGREGALLVGVIAPPVIPNMLSG